MSRCSIAAQAEPLVGTAPAARAWLAIEQPGPWGPRVPADSHLPAAVSSRLASNAAAAGVSLLLIRAVGRHPDIGRGGRTVLASGRADGSVWLRKLGVNRPEELLELDLGGLAAGQPPRGTTAETTVLVCTNGRRDECCARAGRPLAQELHDAGVPVWESSHLGGHRFAPTVLLLPSGLVLGRVTPSQVAEALNDRVPLAALRGYTWQQPAEQVADWAVRRRYDVPAEPLSVATSGDQADVSAHDGRQWQVQLQRSIAARTLSCGKPPEPTHTVTAGAVEVSG